MKEYNRHVGNSPMWGKPMEFIFHSNNCTNPYARHQSHHMAVHV